MTLSQVMAEALESYPRLIIHGRFQNCATVRQLAKLAEAKGYRVEIDYNGFLHDVKLSEGFDSSAPIKDHTIRSAQRYLEQHPGPG